jgi:hypothetical protein
MRVKVYIVTWNDETAINKNLRTLFSAAADGIDLSVTIINNHTRFYLQPEFVNRVSVIHNRATPDFATAMLARMWNTAIIHGFKDLNNPDADIVVTAQDDTEWNFDWLQQIIKVHKSFSFYADDAGDMICSYTPEAVKKIGLWDERFHYGFGEADYFLRALKYNQEKTSINDFAHGRVWQPTLHLGKRPEPEPSRYEEQNRSHQFRNLSWTMFLHKWRLMELEGRWPENILDLVADTPVVAHHILYPYFELSVENLQQKGYIVP